MKLLLSSTPTALWYEIIHDAESMCAIHLEEELEAYLVFLLARHATHPELAKQIIATQFLEGIKLSRNQREGILREVGDKCLLYSGLFPNLAEKRLVKISYFVNLGQAAYDGISKKKNDLYHLLAMQFVGLMDILQSIRRHSNNYPDLLPIQAYELWNETGSQRALSILKAYTQGMPLRKDY